MINLSGGGTREMVLPVGDQGKNVPEKMALRLSWEREELETGKKGVLRGADSLSRYPGAGRGTGKKQKE